MHVNLQSPFFFSSRSRHTSFSRDWSSDVCSSDLCSVWKRLRGKGDQTIIDVPRHIDRSAVIADAGRIDRVRSHFRQDPDDVLSSSEERRVGKECRKCASTTTTNKHYMQGASAKRR